MDSFARLITVTAELIGRIGTRTVFFFLLYGAIFCIQIARLGLLERPAKEFLVCGISWIAVSLLSIAGMRHPAWFIPASALIWITIRGSVPDMAQGAIILVAAGEERLERQARETTRDIPEKIACNESTYPHQTFFEEDPVTDEPRPLLYYSEDEGHIICWDRKGVHPRTGKPLKDVTPAIVERIRYQPYPDRRTRTRPPTEGFRQVTERNPDGFVAVVEKQ